MDQSKAMGVRQRVFLSYSRRDSPFVDRLAASLVDEGFDVDWDRASTDPDNVETGISAEDEWWARLEEMITAADVVVFVVSPDAAASKVCGDEIRYALELGKRRIPVECRRINFESAPPALAALNVKISFADGFDRALPMLVRALSVDVGWRRDQTWLTKEAVRWNKAGRATEVLLAGADLQRAENCALRRPPGVPELADVVIDFIDASRELAVERRAVEDLQRERWQEMEEVTRDLLVEELRVRESQQPSAHGGIVDEQQAHIARVRSLVERADRWHPNAADHVGTTDGVRGYAEVFEFPCCGRVVRDFLATPGSDRPSQLRSDGCRGIPTATRYAATTRSNPFRSVLATRHRELESGSTHTANV